MNKLPLTYVLTLVVAALLSTSAFAYDTGPSEDFGAGPISELRIGYLAHDVDAVSFNREAGNDVNVEILFDSPDFRFFEAIGSPRPHIGGTFNSVGDTSFGYAGLTWQYRFETDIFVEGMLGGAIHDGENDTPSHDRKSLGSDALFHLGVAIGYYLTDHITASFMLDHISNAYLADENEGLDTFGFRLGYKF